VEQVASGCPPEVSEFESRWEKDFSLHLVLTRYQTPTSHPIGIGALYPWGKRPEGEARHASPNIVAAKNVWLYTTNPPTPPSPYIFRA
jgi:hypothetical protein